MSNPKRIASRIDQVINAWEELRPTKSFGGMTLDQFKTQIAASETSRESVKALQTQLRHSRQNRRKSDQDSIKLLSLVVNSVKGDPAEGGDGPLYAAMGYVPESQRRSGLTRKGSTTSPQVTSATVK